MVAVLADDDDDDCDDECGGGGGGGVIFDPSPFVVDTLLLPVSDEW